MSSVARTFAFVGSLTLAVLLPNVAAADEVHLLNCKLMDRQDPWYDRWCSGESGTGICQTKRCLLKGTVVVISNFNSLYNLPHLRWFFVTGGKDRDIPDTGGAPAPTPVSTTGAAQGTVNQPPPR